MNPYESPQTVDRGVKEVPPKRKMTWGEIALMCLIIGVTQVAIHLYLDYQREQKQAEMMKKMMQQLQQPIPVKP